MATETEWRRRWKSSLAACPWHSVGVDGENLLIKMKFSDKSYEVLITDLTSFWHESLEEKDLKKRIEKLNPSIEAPVTKFLDQIQQNLEKPEKHTKLSVNFKKSENGAGQKMVFKITSVLAGMPFVWTFHADPADDSMARDHLTVPLLAMVSELFRRQQELCKIVTAKDKEIDDYKSQGVRTSRKHIETAKFDGIAFKNSMVTSKGFEDQVKKLETATFDGEGQELYRQIVTKHAWLSHKAGGDGEEEDMSDEESIPMSGQGAASTKQSWANRLPPSFGATKGGSPAKTPTASPTKSPAKSPAKSPGSASSSSDNASPLKDTEKLRREALERKLEQEEMKKQEKKKKKKLAL
ncbi:non-homologous end-joining factor 1-like [Littorina saxatilis]|uniref:Non-homologous end-joining factor 1 n=1 Tax=Littorina saxatilis TaxID=31220 RepID=A0AAN9AUR1_9CAEN